MENIKRIKAKRGHPPNRTMSDEQRKEFEAIIEKWAFSESDEHDGYIELMTLAHNAAVRKCAETAESHMIDCYGASEKSPSDIQVHILKNLIEENTTTPKDMRV